MKHRHIGAGGDGPRHCLRSLRHPYPPARGARARRVPTARQDRVPTPARPVAVRPLTVARRARRAGPAPAAVIPSLGGSSLQVPRRNGTPHHPPRTARVRHRATRPAPLGRAPGACPCRNTPRPFHVKQSGSDAVCRALRGAVRRSAVGSPDFAAKATANVGGPSSGGRCSEVARSRLPRATASDSLSRRTPRPRPPQRS